MNEQYEESGIEAREIRKCDRVHRYFEVFRFADSCLLFHLKDLKSRYNGERLLAVVHSDHDVWHFSTGDRGIDPERNLAEILDFVEAYETRHFSTLWLPRYGPVPSSVPYFYLNNRRWYSPF